MSIFREYDIRGVFGKDLTTETGEAIGRAFGTRIRRNAGQTVSLGYDIRPSGPALRSAVIEGLRATGLNVVDIGACPTPTLYFSLHQLKVDGGIMITASHNPSEYNGFKLCSGKQALFGDEIQEIKRTIDRQDYGPGQKTGNITIENNFLATYRDYFTSHFKPFQLRRGARPLRVVVDCGNGTASLIAPEIFKQLQCDMTPLFCEPDGRFPNHHPDPTVPENLVDLIAEVRKQGADLGIAFDGDADRLGVVDEQGEIIWGDRLALLFATEILKERPNATIVSEVKASQVLYDEVTRLGGNGIMWKAGHSIIKAKMRETGAAFGGEVSGHFFFADRHFGFDDAIYAGCRLMEILAQRERPLSSYFAGLPKLSVTPEIRVNCPDEKKFEVVEQCRKQLKQTYQTIDVDGVRFLFPGGWGLIRASNTQPALVLRFEADSPALLDEMQGKVKALLTSLL